MSEELGFNFLDEDIGPQVSGPAMPTPPTPPGPMGSAVPSKVAPFLMALPLILRGRAGGMGAAAAFLQGLQQAQQMKAGQAQQVYQNQNTQFQQQRQTVADQRAQAQIDATNKWRNDQLAAQAQTRQANAIQGAIKTLMESDPDVASLLMPVLQSQLRAVGVTDLSPLDQTMNVVTNPTRVEKRWAERQLAKWESLDENEKGRLASATYRNPANGKDYTLDQLYQTARGMSGVTVAKPRNPVSLQSKDVLVNGTRMLAGFDPATNNYYAPGDTSTPLTGKIVEYNKPTGGSGGASDGLPPRIQTLVNSKANTFNNLPIVKRVQTMAEAVSFADGLKSDTVNPADDQALIYAFAKAMDPDSVVREGEYATVQKYAQSWAESFGFTAARIFSNSPFLTPQARQNMKATIRSKYAAALPQYQNVRKSYVSQINKLTRAGDGEEYLTDYGAAFPPAAPQGGGGAATGASYQDYLNRKKGSR